MEAHPVADYAINWLAQHGEMPTGIHTARATRPIRGFYTTYSPQEVDFTSLHRLASSGKSQQPLQAPALAKVLPQRLEAALGEKLAGGRWRGPGGMAETYSDPAGSGALRKSQKADPCGVNKGLLPKMLSCVERIL